MLAAALLLTGCADYDLALNEADSAYYGDSEASGALDDAFREPLRIDVQPISELDGAPLLPQSFWLDATEDWTDLRLTLQPTITVTGTITGFVANPYGSAPTVPGARSEPIEAQVELYQPDTINTTTTTTDEDGRFWIDVPAGDDYRLVVRPLDATGLPLVIHDRLQLLGSSGETVDLNDAVEDQLLDSLELDYADPVYGRVTDADGLPVDCRVRLVDAETGEEGASVETSAQGYYYLRAEPGEHVLEIIGDASDAVPTVRRQISFEAGLGGGQFDVSLGELEPVLIQGTVVAKTSSARQRDATVRLTSRSLEFAEGILVTEDITNSNGNFLIQALPGEWTVEVIPGNETASGLSPIELALTIGDDALDLGPQVLPPKVAFERQVLDVTGQPASDVLLTFYQQGFNGATTSARTDAAGFFTAELADVPQTAYLTPTSSPESAITRREVLNPSVDATLNWALADGAEVSGVIAISGASGASGAHAVDVRSADGTLYGSVVATGYDSLASFSLRVNLANEEVAR